MVSVRRTCSCGLSFTLNECWSPALRGCQCILHRWHTWSRGSSACWTPSWSPRVIGQSWAQQCPWTWLGFSWTCRICLFREAKQQLHMAHMHITLCQSYQQRTQGNNTAHLMHVSFFFCFFAMSVLLIPQSPELLLLLLLRSNKKGTAVRTCCCSGCCCARWTDE